CRPPLMTGTAWDWQPAKACSWSPDGWSLALIGSDNMVRVWDTVTSKRLPLGGAEDGRCDRAALAVRSVAFHPGGKLLALPCAGAVELWELGADRPRWQVDVDGEYWPAVLRFSADGKALAVGACGAVTLLETSTG